MVIIVITIITASISKLYNNQSITENQAKINNDITILKYAIWSLPQDINNVVIDNIWDFKQVNSVYLKINKDWISDYKYLTLDDYKNKLYNNSHFLWFNNIWTKNLDYDKIYTVNGNSYPTLIKQEIKWVKKNKYDTKLSDFQYLKSCVVYKNNDSTQTIKYNLEKGDTINILLTPTNSFLITKPDKLINWADNTIIKKMYCQLVDFMWNEHKIVLLF